MTDPVFLATLASEIEDIATHAAELNGTNAKIELLRLVLRCRAEAIKAIKAEIDAYKQQATWPSTSDGNKQFLGTP